MLALPDRMYCESQKKKEGMTEDTERGYASCFTAWSLLRTSSNCCFLARSTSPPAPNLIPSSFFSSLYWGNSSCFSPVSPYLLCQKVFFLPLIFSLATRTNRTNKNFHITKWIHIIKWFLLRCICILLSPHCLA